MDSDQNPITSNNNSTPPPRYGPNPNPPTFTTQPTNTSPEVPQPKKRSTLVLVAVGLLVLILIGIVIGLVLPKLQTANKTSTEPTNEATQNLAPSLISMVKGSENWQNGRFEVAGGHGLPDVKGTFIKTSSGQFYTVADTNQQAIDQGLEELKQITKKDHPRIYKGNEYQLNTLGLLNQIGYGFDANVFDFLEDLLVDFGDPSKAPVFASCENDLDNYYSKARTYLTSLKPNYVHNQEYQSELWYLDTTELFNNLSVKAQTPACYEFLDKLLKYPVETDVLVGTQLIFEVTEESEDGAMFKVFGAPAPPSEDYTFFYKMKISNVNKTQPPTSFTSDPTSLFSRNSAFALVISQCGRLPVIAQSIDNLPKYVTPEQTNLYKGPQIRDYGYFCTGADAEVDQYQKS